MPVGKPWRPQKCTRDCPPPPAADAWAAPWSRTFPTPARSDRSRKAVRRVTRCLRAADDSLVSTDAHTQAIPRVPAGVVAVTNARVAAPGRDTEAAAPAPDAQVVAPEHSTEIACEQSV